VILNADGSISGNPTGTGAFTIKVTDANGLSSTGNCPYSVGAAPALACVATTTGQAGLPYSAAAPTVTGGTAPYTFSVATGTMPAGLTLNTATGAISGIPATSGTWTIQVTDAKGITAAGTCAYMVTAAPTTTPIAHGDAATIGFWHNKNGQALILSMNGSASDKNLATWLATSFPSLYGATSTHNLTGKTNTDVAALFMTFFAVKGTNTDAQVMGGALAIYVTNPALAGSSVASGYGFSISATGTGAKTYNTGSNGTAIGLSNNTSYTVTQLMQAANAVAPYSSAAFNALNTIFDGINTTGDIK
jgi:large repetitive protein